MSNEAAGRLRNNLAPSDLDDLDAALAAERAAGRAEAESKLFAADHHEAIATAARRATVERIRERLTDFYYLADSSPQTHPGVFAILDEEAAR